MMMNVPLTISSMIERAEKLFPKKEIVSRTHDTITTLTYKQLGERTRRLSSALQKLGIKEGERVGTLAWNHHRHVEAYFAIPSIGSVLHTINIRLSAQHISYIIGHAEDRILLVDEDLVPLVEKIQSELLTVQAYIIMTDKKELPETSLEPVYHYEQLLTEGDPDFQFLKDMDENTPAGMCYTSATTGNPKGVVYTHRSTVLHCMALGLADTAALSESDVAMAIVPMFHVNAWGLPFAATWFGSKQVLPGPMFTPKILLEMIQDEKVTLAAGVPTIWLGVLQELENNNYDLSSMKRILCGGAAAPKSVIAAFEQKHNVPFVHAYGMTETSPLVTLARLKSYETDLSYEEQLEIRSKQGYLVPGVEMKVVGVNGEVKWDGAEMGELCLRAPWIAASYYNDERTVEGFRDGWLYTGDVVTVDEEGCVKIVDRTKDVIKSGGEWISSVDLENALMAHEAVFEAAVVAVPHPQWQERPVACVVQKQNSSVTKEELYEFLRPQFAKWWLPDDIVFMEEIPKTSVGKFLKQALRKELEHLHRSSEK
ncbi:long-chain fatty acid--CoA ligase [Bacillus pseudomycoides]|uniref:Fatty-acid--CoA ligase n=1 Tax=Bacillus pseudomycoides TaxID=64104 RepID=A0A2B6R4F7_9BACI|nr:long-chain fatty acid--CoA ligase [Bacillus pseudomycoides]EOP51575.1 medium-chain-fatty-acid-CoA ligase [Bacillus cereus VD136]EEM04683.1 Acyl-CoA synthetase (AMP-forming)/AMP-acid ligases II [Bacillus pseudomycoides]EEM10258.1 Acyl-CoA synthetase (AMP-forming)/AMP-acid ligases II [Bacillus pseudomycoides]KFN12572.1 AMP-binding enzyme family protein [Bacillus pseudomycoides]MBD5799754.1 fatty-acid--CoA ligase [Bacillus pseudomycoides]